MTAEHGRPEKDAAPATDGDDSVAAAMRDVADPSRADDALARVRARMGLADEPGTIGGYRIEGRLGEGAMGVVYLAHDDRLGRKVAIKLLSVQRPSPRQAERLVREARGLARLSHPNVLTVYEAGRHGDAVYLVTEYAPGGDLATHLAERRPALAEILRLFEEAGRGLAAAHDAGLVHRDFKPANVLLDAHGHAKVADFGLVRSLDDSTSLSSDALPPDGEDDRGTDRPPASLTRTGALVGSPAYMALEVLGGTVADPRSDQFSFCVALYEAVAGVRPFAGDTIGALAEAIEAQRFQAPRAGRSIPRWLLRILRRGLARDPADRFPDMHALLRALDRRTARRRMLAAGGLIGAGVLAGVLGVFATEESPCAQGAQTIAEVWNDEARARLGRAFEAAALPYGDVLLPSVTGALDRYAAAWADAHRRACEDTRVHGTQSEAAMDRRMWCLERRKQALSATVDTLVGAEAKALTRAYDVVAALPSLAPCEDAEALARRGEIPEDEARRAAVEQLEADLARAKVKIVAGSVAEARSEIQALLERAGTLDWPRAEAEVDLAWARVLEEQGNPKEANEVLRRAFATALAAGADEQAGYAASIGIHVAATRLQDPEMADDWWWLAEPFRRRLASDRTFAAKLLANRANMLLMRGEHARANEVRSTAIEILSDVLGPNAPEVAEQRANLAVGYRRLGDPKRAIAEFLDALEILRETYGPLHPKLGPIYNNLGTAQFDLGRLDDAQASYATSLEIKQATLPPGHPSIGNAYLNLAEVFMEKSAFDDARSSAERAHGIWTKALGPEHPLTVEAVAVLARIESRSGHGQRAAEILRSALADRAAEGGVAAAELAWQLAQLLDAELDDRPAALARARYALGIFRQAGRSEQADAVAAWLRIRDPSGGTPDEDRPPPADAGDGR